MPTIIINTWMFAYKSENQGIVPPFGQFLVMFSASEQLFSEDWNQDIQSQLNSDVYNALTDVLYNYSDTAITKEDIEQALEWFELHFFESDDFEETFVYADDILSESFASDAKDCFENGLSLDDASKKLKDSYPNLSDSTLRRKISMEYDRLDESLPVKIAKEQLNKFAEGLMPEGWTVDAYLNKLTEKKHITKEEQTSLKEWFINEGTVSRKSLKTEKDLSKVEKSMTKVLEDNIELVNSAKSTDDLYNIVNDLFVTNSIDTNASNRLLNNIKKQRNLTGAQSVIFNSMLKGEGKGVI